MRWCTQMHGRECDTDLIDLSFFLTPQVAVAVAVVAVVVVVAVVAVVAVVVCCCCCCCCCCCFFLLSLHPWMKMAPQENTPGMLSKALELWAFRVSVLCKSIQAKAAAMSSLVVGLVLAFVQLGTQHDDTIHVCTCLKFLHISSESQEG